MILTNLTPSLNTPCPPQLPRLELTHKKKTLRHTQDHPPLSAPLSNDIILDLVSLKWSLACVERGENESRLFRGRRTSCTQIDLTMFHYKVVDQRREMKQKIWKIDERWQPSWMNTKDVFLNTFICLSLFLPFVMNEIPFCNFLKTTYRLAIHTVGLKSPLFQIFIYFPITNYIHSA